MGILQTILPLARSADALGLPQAAAKAGNTPATQNAAIQQALTSGQAAYVTISSANPKRAVTSGDKRSVDASYGKQEAKEEITKKEDKKKSTAGAAVDVSA